MPQTKLLGYVSLIAIIITLDQGIKYLAPNFGPIVKNYGVIFGFLPSQATYLIALGVGLLILVLLQNTFSSASAFLLGGATSNLIDRLQYGFVVDYIDINRWLFDGKSVVPVFNIADVTIVIGAALLLKELITSDSKARRKQ